MKPFHNWSGSLVFQPQQLCLPDSEAALQTLVAQTAQRGQRLRVVGAAHSFTPLIETSDTLVSLDAWQGIEQLDIERQQVWVRAGTRLHRLNRELAAYGLALANLGDIDHQSIAGAISTGTHGTGLGLGNLSSQVVGLRLITADGQVHTLDAQHPWLPAARVSLGALGVISAVALQVVPAYRLRLAIRKALLQDVLAELPRLLAAHRHVEFFVFPGSPHVQLKLSDLTTEAISPRWQQAANELLLENMAFWGLSELSRRVPASTAAVARLCGWAVSDQVQVDDSWRIFANQRWTRFQEMEYALPLEAFADTLTTLLERIAREQVRVHFPIECRFSQGDDAWLSPAHGRDSAYIAVHQYQGMPWQDYFRRAESVFVPAGGRPHWGKHHFLGAQELAACYPEWASFAKLRAQLDLQGCFLNPHLARLLQLTH
ncbi:MAG: D-arabinono-1,4-lactone oxidase [Candidatus Sericytochromatia bacterium]